MSSVGALETLYGELKEKAEFQIVYIREAHPGYYLNKYRVKVANPQSLVERGQNAHSCLATLNCTIPAVVDGMDNKVNDVYQGWPDRLYIIGADGKIAYRGGPGPGGFKVHQMAAKLREMVGAAAPPRPQRQKEKDMWASAKGAEPPVQKNNKGLDPGTPAPDFTLLDSKGANAVTLSSFKGKKPVVLFFGSHSWLPFTRAAADFEAFYREHKDRAAIHIVYVREGTPGYYYKDFDLTVPFDESIEIRRQNASKMVETRKLTMPCLVDGFDDATARAFGGWPSTIVAIDTTGKVVYASRSRGRGGDAINAAAEIGAIKKKLGF